MQSLEAIYLFRHAAIRDVVYSLHLPSTRAELHCAAFEALEQEFAGRTDQVALELATHARQGREGLAGQDAQRLLEAEFRYLRVAEKRLSARAQWQQCAEVVDLALATGCGTTLERCILLHSKVGALDYLGKRHEMLDAAMLQVRLGREAGSLQHQLLGMSAATLTHINLGEHARAEELLAEAKALADESGSARERSKVRMDHAMLCTTRGESKLQEELLLEGLALLDESAASLRWPILGSLANLYSGTGRIDRAITLLNEVLDGCRERDATSEDVRRTSAIALVNLARQYMLKGNLEAAETQFRQAIDLAIQIGNRRSVAFAQANLAEIDMHRGELERARTGISATIDIVQEFGLPLYHAAYQCTLAQIELLLGHEARAQELVEDSRAEFLDVGGEAFIAEYCGITRLRIAASHAVSAAVPGRATSTLRTAPPAKSWLPVMREIAASLQQSRDSKGGRASTPLENAVRDGHALVAEIQAAIEEARPALIFRGHRPAEMLPGLRKALVAAIDPAEAALMQRRHPRLWQALNA